MTLPLSNSSLLKTQAFINGCWIHAESQNTFAVDNPATQEILAQVADLGTQETEWAISSAAEAFKHWRMTTAAHRSKLLKQLAQLMYENENDLATLLTLENGKPLSESRGEVNYAASFIEWFAQEAPRAYGDIIPSSVADRRLWVIHQPIGVVAAITPWNFPLAMLTRKCAPALAAGCTIIVKPAEETPLSALALGALAEQAGIPAGVLNILTARDPVPITKILCASPNIRKLTFTGSTAVGKLLLQQSADTVKKVSLELGNNAPFIVFEDADVDAAVAGAIASKFRNSGQTCVCANRFYLHEKIFDEFTEKFTRAVSTLRVGNGMEPNVQQGPLINARGVAKVTHQIRDALDQGATLHLGGKVHELGGTFFEPTVLSDLNHNMLIAQEETFGPVAPLFRFHDEQVVIEQANHTQLGLAAYFYTQNINRVWRVAEALEFGIVAINTGMFSAAELPFGGYKESGLGREGSKYGLAEFLEVKSICLGGINT